MAIPPEIFWWLHVPEVYLVPKGWQGVTCRWRWYLRGKGGVQGRSAGWVQCAGSGL
jgi:hypothetical protein